MSCSVPATTSTGVDSSYPVPSPNSTCPSDGTFVVHVTRALVAVNPGPTLRLLIRGPLSTCTPTCADAPDRPSRSVARADTVCGVSGLKPALLHVTVYGAFDNTGPTGRPSTKNCSLASGTSSSTTADNWTAD